MDNSRKIGEDGSGKDIGKVMKDGGKADTKDMEEILDHAGPPPPLDLTNLQDHLTMEATVMAKSPHK